MCRVGRQTGLGARIALFYSVALGQGSLLIRHKLGNVLTSVGTVSLWVLRLVLSGAVRGQISGRRIKAGLSVDDDIIVFTELTLR